MGFDSHGLSSVVLAISTACRPEPCGKTLSSVISTRRSETYTVHQRSMTCVSENEM